MQTPSPQLMVIDFRPDGAVEAMHRDRFNLGFLGKQQVSRASEIIFDENTQKWDIHVGVGDKFLLVEGAKGFENYDDARRYEVRWLEQCRLHDFEPTSTEGQRILAVLRTMFD